MDPKYLEFAKMGISLFLLSVQMGKMTEEQAMKLFNEEKAKFDANDPNKLKQV